MSPRTSAAALFLTSALAACGSPPEPTQAEASGPISAPAPTSSKSGPGEAHAVALQAIGCWYGGLWSDGEGTPAEERKRASERRCASLVTRLYGSADQGRYEQLRLIDAGVVDRVVAEVVALASADSAVDGPHKDGLVKLVRAVAAAQRENNDAHLAADAVRLDLKNRPADPDTLSKDEAAAVKPLRTHAGLDALLHLDAGDLTPEAHALGLFAAMDRLELARALPKHLKVYAVCDALQAVFGVAPPEVPSDPTTKLKPGTWLGYLTDVARAAGHPVPDKAQTPRERDPWAWGGVIEGLADKLRADAASSKPPFAPVATAITKALDAEWAEIPEMAARQGAMGAQEAKQKGK